MDPIGSASQSNDMMAGLSERSSDSAADITLGPGHAHPQRTCIRHDLLSDP